MNGALSVRLLVGKASECIVQFFHCVSAIGNGLYFFLFFCIGVVDCVWEHMEMHRATTR